MRNQGLDRIEERFSKTGRNSGDPAPAKAPTAVRYSRLTYGEVLAKSLKATDITAMALAMDNDMTMVCFGLNEENSIVRVVRGEEIGTTVKNHF